MITLLLLLLAGSPARAGFVEEAREAQYRCDFDSAFALLAPAARAGDPAAMSALADYYRSLPEVHDEKTALAWLRRAAAAGEPYALYDLATHEESPEKAKKLYARAIDSLKKEAMAEDPDAMLQLSRFTDPKFSFAVDMGAADAEGSRQWSEKARVYWLRRAEAGDAKAQSALAHVLFDAPDGSANTVDGVKWLAQASEQGYAPAMDELGYKYMIGDGVPKDKKKARKLCEKALAQGYCVAYASLENLWIDGKDRDIPRALEIAEKAEAAGAGSRGVCSFADYYLSGLGVSPDPMKAYRLAKPRAEAGMAGCQYVMGESYRDGAVVSKDPAEALKWFLLGSNDVSARLEAAKLKASVTADVVRDAEQRAAEFRPVPLDLPNRPHAAPKAQAAAPKPAPRPETAILPPPVEEPVEEPSVDSPKRKLKDNPHDFALIVGIERYKGLPAAQYAENDAVAVRANLRSLGVPERNIISLMGDAATRSKLQAYLEEWLPRNVKADSRVFFYYSGHGSPDAATGQAFLVPSDGDPEFLKSTAYPLSQVYQALDRLPAKQVVVALDSCFSGAGGRSVLPKGARPLVTRTDIGAPPAKLVVFAASAGDELSLGDDDQQHGAFTYYFLRGLSGEARKDGAVTAGGLEDYLRTKVGDLAHRQNRDQTPQLLGNPRSVLFALP